MTTLKYKFADNGNCRVYYTNNGCLYCYQATDGRYSNFDLLRCTRDGEPSHTVSFKDLVVERPKGDERIEQELRWFLITRRFECRTCGERSLMDPPDCPRGATHCDIMEVSQ